MCSDRVILRNTIIVKLGKIPILTVRFGFWAGGVLECLCGGFLKSQFYANKPQTTVALKANTAHAIGQIQPDYAPEPWKIVSHLKARHPQRSHGRHLNDVIFHI